MQGPAAKRRCGAAAVEFAIVVPIVLVFVFSLVELSRLMMFDGNVTSAVLVGLREATLVDATSGRIEEAIRRELAKSNIRQSTIRITPSNVNSKVRTLRIELDVPIRQARGITPNFLLLHRPVVRKSIEFERE